VAFLNYAAKCTLPANFAANLEDMLGASVETGVPEENIGIVCMPQFTYHKNKLYLQEVQVLRQLGDRGLAFDHRFSLVYAEKADLREDRPTSVDCRCVSAGSMNGSWVWSKSHLLLAGRTEPVPMLKSSAMKKVEDLTEEHLPEPGTETQHVRGAYKFKQFGPQAWEQVLAGLFQGGAVAELKQRVVLIVDLTPDVGDVAAAYLKLKPNWKFPAVYVGVAENPTHLSWLEEHLRQLVAEAWLTGALPDRANPPRMEVHQGGQAGRVLCFARTALLRVDNFTLGFNLGEMPVFDLGLNSGG